MNINHTDLINYQHSLLERLTKKDDVKKISKDTIEFIKELYLADDEIPNGAEIGININNSCNLKCSHCYYAGTHLIQAEEINALKEEEWNKIIEECNDLGIHHINIIGKEPLLSPKKTRTVLSKIDYFRNKGNDIKYELITNGTLIENEISWLSQFPDFYFFSISFDGYRDIHDSIRGTGNYLKSKQGLKHANKHRIKNISATFCAMPSNVNSLEEMLVDLTPLGLEYLSIGLCFPTDYNNKENCADFKVFSKVLDSVKSAPKELDISINLMSDEHPSLIAKIFNEGYLQKENLAVTQDYAPSLILPLNKNPRTAINISILPIMFLSGFRIDYDGTAIDFCADLQSKHKKGFGNIRDSSLKKLYKISREELWPKYTQQYFQRLSNAFQGRDIKSIKSVYA